jgi:tetratricopeptide (TPR) repeat protein
MAFNKSKHLEAAQKLLAQGKLAQAIAEYESILKNEPKDQVTLMTVGDLHVRNNDPQRALEKFERLAGVFLSDGFNSKAIAIYKKIQKLAPESTAALEKLAELYVQQGVMNEARSLYVQLAELHMKGGRSENAVGVLRQLLDLEPENLRVQVRLADLYQNIGQQKEAAHAYLNCAHRMLDQGQFGEAQKYADMALKTDAGNPSAVMIKARAAAALGHSETAIELLEKLPAASEGTDVTQLLLGLYLQTRNTDRAVALAEKVHAADAARYPVMYDLAVQLLDAGEPEKALHILSKIRGAMLEATDYERLSQALATAAERLPGRVEPLEWLVDVYRRSSDSFRLPQALDQLAEATAASGDLDRARQLFEELLEKEPDDEDVRRRLNQVRVRLGLEPLEEGSGPAPKIAPAPATITSAPPAAPPQEEQLDEETHRFITQALTDVDLFSSYGLTQKAIDLLESAVKRAPRHSGVLEKLLDLHLGAGNDRRTAELAAHLEQIHRGRGDQGRAERFAELQRRFQRAARLSGEEPAAPPAPVQEFAVPPAAPAAEAVTEVEAQPEGEAAVHEVDLSEEWASLSTMTAEEPASAAAEAPAEVMQEAAAPAEEEVVLSLDEPAPAEAVVEAAAEAVPAVEGPERIPLEEPAAEPAAAQEVPVEVASEAAPAVAREEVEYVLEPAPAASAEPVPAMTGEGVMSTEEFMTELAAEVDSLAIGAPPVKAKVAPPPAPAAAPLKQEAAEQLKEVFDEFRSELGQMEEEEGADLETHYNLGIAYREMGLLEEAIGEFQKVAKAIQNGQPFRYAMQCCTLLGLSFMEKGQHKVAAMWYEKALAVEGLDQESILALRYDLGVAQESAGDVKAALDSFEQVYAMNIDYRDVAERIASLQKRR